MTLSIAFFPPIEWFAALARDFDPRQGLFSVVDLESREHYQKQSWRNRCRIMAAGGPEYLSFPVVHQGDIFHTPVTEIMVDYSTPWVKQMQTAICSAYDSSAYFEYYKDELFSILDSHPATLWELDMSIIEFFIRKTGLQAQMRPTDAYRKDLPDDLREVIHPKRENNLLEDYGLAKPYFQVFSGKYGFVKGLSIMDLLFNEGPDSILWLKRL